MKTEGKLVTRDEETEKNASTRDRNKRNRKEQKKNPDQDRENKKGTQIKKHLKGREYRKTLRLPTQQRPKQIR